MEQRRLGPGGPAVGAVGLGCMPLSLAGRPTEADAVRVIHAALEAGVTLLDTADVYCLDDNDLGHNERLIARALKTWGGDRAAVKVATKGGLRRPRGDWVPDARPARLRAACEASLSALGVDALDLYQLHAPDPAVPFEESVGALARLREEGKFRLIGLSNVTAGELSAALAMVEVASVQNRYSVYDVSAERDGVLEACAQRSIAFIAYGPLGGKRRSRRLAAEPELSRIAARLGASPHQVALAWLLAKAPVVVPIPGASTAAHAADSAAADQLRLQGNDMTAIDRTFTSTWRRLRERLRPR